MKTYDHIKGGCATPVFVVNEESSFLFKIAEGRLAGYQSWNKTGYNGDVDIANIEDVISQGSVYVFPTVKQQMDIVSSSANDSASGTGIRKLILRYLDDSFIEKSEIITLNGLTVVHTTATDIYRVQCLSAYECGSHGKADGNITLSELGGSTYKYGYVSLGNTRDRQCVWTVPKGKTLYITTACFSVGGTTKERTAIFTDLSTYDAINGVINNFFSEYHEVVIEDGSFTREFEIPTRLPSGSDIKVQVKALNDNCIVSCSLHGWIENS